jgi:alkylation response protein AidB-like acyl-CoA dehydrogenase
MLVYDAPVNDIRFLLEAFGYERVEQLDAFSDYDIETVEMMLEQSGRFFSEEVLPTNPVGDEQGIDYDPETQQLETPDGFKEVYEQVAANGYVGICTPQEYGGGGAPESLGVSINEMATATNKSLAMFTLLSTGLSRALLAHGTDEQKETYLPKLASGEWGATMALTEPHCGTDLGLLRTRAEPEGDHYKLSGKKIWITGGEHDLTDNIVHFVLARLPDAPEGIKGISAFLVPKYLEDGTRNPAFCTGVEHKMGIHGSPTCEMEFDEAVGYMVGEPNQGMRSMFVMMNEARLKVGIEGVALSEIAYQTALGFAKDRRQSRSSDPDKRDADNPADPILVHPDVRRMFADVKATTEGMRALVAWTSINLDLADHHPDEETSREAEDLVALLTPVIKAFCTKRGFENISEAMQICGGAGYTTDMHIEQYMRDMRIGMIYEGTNHIQALDLVGRKLAIDDGRLFETFQQKVGQMVEQCEEIPELSDFAETLRAISGELTSLTRTLGQRAAEDAEQAGAVANHYLDYLALTAIGYAWLRQLKHGLETDHDGIDTKLKTGRFYFNQILPETRTLANQIRQGKSDVMAFDQDEF